MADITSNKTRSARALWPMIVLCCGPLLAARAWLMALKLPPNDFIIYWASGKLFLAGENPWSPSATLALEREHGWPGDQPLIMFSPPWALPFVAPFSRIPFEVAHLLWFALSITLTWASALALWGYFGGQRRYAWSALLVAATFVPAGAAEHQGQITPLMLASLTAFLLLIDKERFFTAGLVLLGLGFKPHLLYLVFAAVFLWSARQRQWKVLAGGLVGYALAAISALVFNPNVLDYFHYTYGPAMNTASGAGAALRLVLGTEKAWLQFVPSILGIMWFLWYWAKRRRDWNWRTDLPIVLVVSVSSSVYGWFHDFILILPAIILLAVRGLYRSPVVLITFLATQEIITMSAAAESPAWMSAASLLWIPFYVLSSCSRENSELAAASHQVPERGRQPAIDAA